MKSNYWIIGLLVIAVAVLLYFLLHEPKQLDSHGSDYERVIADNKAFTLREAQKLKIIDSLETSGRSKDSVITALKNEQATTRKSLDKTTANANRLAKEVKELQRGDTSQFGRKCDSLAEQAQNFAFLYEQYKGYSDSLSAKMDSQNEDYVNALEELRKLYTELKQQHEQLLESYKKLFVDYAKAQKSVRRERLKTKIAALLALVGGAAAVLK